MIVVTGASKGIGRAIAERLQAAGRDVFGIARDIDGLPFPAVSCDISYYDQVKAVAHILRGDKQVVTGLVNAAGIASMNLAVTTPAEVSQRLISTNLLGTIYCCQLFSPLMMRHKAGSIVNFSTIAVAIGLKGESIYAASKAGVEGFTRSFAREMADFNIRVNCIAPGPIETALIRGVTRRQIDNVVSHQIIPRQFTPDDVCDLVDILLDRKSSSLSGQLLNVGGA